MVAEVENGEVAEAIGEAVVVPNFGADVLSRVERSLAIAAYVRAEKRFSDASQAFNEACQDVRKKIGKSAKFVAKIDWQTYLVTSDDEGNFSVEPIDSI